LQRIVDMLATLETTKNIVPQINFAYFFLIFTNCQTFNAFCH